MGEPYLRLVADGPRLHLLFAAQVLHWPFAELSKHVWEPWGSDVQAQLLERQLRFVGALHPGYVPPALRIAESFTLDLRYIYRPGAAQVDCVVLGKVTAQSEEEGRPRALTLWEKLSALAPLGYSFRAATSDLEFADWSGEDLARQADASDLPWAEIRRPGESLPQSSLPVIYPFGWQLSGWEMVWQAQVRLNKASVVSVSLRPVSLELAEEGLLTDLAHVFEEAAADTPSPLSAQVAEFAGLYASYLSVARALFSLRVVVKGPAAIQNAVCGALSNYQDQDRLNNLVNVSDYPSEIRPVAAAWGQGSAVNVRSLLSARVEVAGDVAGRDIAHHQHSYNLETRRYGLRLEVAKPSPAEEGALRANFEKLEQAHWRADARFAPFVDGALRYLVDTAGALCAFRLPLLPADGLPGVRVGAESRPPERGIAATGEAAGAPQGPEAAPAEPAQPAGDAAHHLGRSARDRMKGRPKARTDSDAAPAEND